tara:strand:- start:11177 stop:11782 length:606 start_codon:yes stop_codon:yes gene_type:complete
MNMRGKWAEGIMPRNLIWIVKDRLAVCERPGGYGPQHRKVRRIEELIWIRRNDFKRVISIIPATHNLHNYEEFDIDYVHRPIAIGDHLQEVLGVLYVDLNKLIAHGERLLMHHEDVGDDIGGTMAGYLVWNGFVDTPHRAITVIERMINRVIGSHGREIVAAAMELPSPEELTPEEESEDSLNDESSEILDGSDFEEIISE